MYRPNELVCFDSARALPSATTHWAYDLPLPHRWREGRIVSDDGADTLEVDLTEVIVGSTNPPPRYVVPRQAVKPRSIDTGCM